MGVNDRRVGRMPFDSPLELFLKQRKPSNQRLIEEGFQMSRILHAAHDDADPLNGFARHYGKHGPGRSIHAVGTASGKSVAHGVGGTRYAIFETITGFRRKPKIVAPPGHLFGKFYKAILPARVYREIVEQTIADMRVEQNEALLQHDITSAHGAVRRGRVALLSIGLGCILRLLERLWKLTG